MNCRTVDPELYISQIWNEDAVRVVPVCPETASTEAYMTAELITACFEQRNTGIRTIECHARFQELSERMNLLYRTLERHLKAPTNRASRTLRGMLDRGTPFAGFTRTYVRLHLEYYPDLAPCVAL